MKILEFSRDKEQHFPDSIEEDFYTEALMISQALAKEGICASLAFEKEEKTPRSFKLQSYNPLDDMATEHISCRFYEALHTFMPAVGYSLSSVVKEDE